MRWPALFLSAAAVGLFAFATTRPSRYSFKGKVVLVTGGSRGLGLVLARQLVKRGAHVGLLARDSLELARARRSISHVRSVLLLQADVADPAQVNHAVGVMIRHFGQLDVVVNNAGVIVSAPFDDTSASDFQALLDVHLFGTLNVTRAALPYLVRRDEARIINICSIGGKIGVPHLSAYCASKFAQAGLSMVMAEELREKGICVTTVYPGLMRTGSHVNAWFKGRHEQEFAAFALAGGLPGTSMGAERAARQILAASERGVAEAVIPFTVRQISRAAALAPGTTVAAMALANRALPPASSRSAKQGSELPLPPAVRTAVRLSERAADRNNER